jgi:hypothetical protein
MRNLMKLLAVVAIVAMMAGGAVAATLHASKGDVVKHNSGTITRGALDCTAVEELFDGYNNPFLYNGGPNNVTTWPGWWDCQAGEVVFHIDFDAGGAPYGYNWTFSYTAPCDLDLFVMSGCGEEYTFYGNDLSPLSGTGGWTGELWFALDGWQPTDVCFFEVLFTMTEYVPFDFCADVIDVSGTGMFTGDTCDGYHTPAGSCPLVPPQGAQYYSDGLEDYYGVFMPAGSSFSAAVTHTCDASLRLMDACLEPVACVAYTDYYWSGNPPANFENLTFTNDTGAAGMFYLVIDAYDVDCCGTYEMDFQSTGGAIPNEAMSMGEVKALWR